MIHKLKLSNFKKSEILKKNLNIEEIKMLSIFLNNIFKKSLFFQLKRSFSVEFLNWLYNENPNGKAITNNVYENGKIIAHFALIPISVVYNKKIYKSALTVFTAVDKNHRGLYFLQLGNKIIEQAKLEGIKFIIGIANQISTDLYVKCFKFKLISPLTVKIGLSDFQEKNNLHHKFEVLRDKKTLEWRLNNPRFKYQIYKKNEDYIIFNNIYKLFKMNMGYFSNKNFNLDHKFHLINSFNLNPFNMWIGLNNNLKNTKMSFDFPNI